MFWFNKQNPDTLYADIREESHVLCDGRELHIKPDIVCDFRAMPFPDEVFKLVVFDPPHLKNAGPNGWQGKKYGILSDNWKNDIMQGFSECMRVLEIGGTLIFKWNEDQIKVSEILKAIGYVPLFGHKSGKQQKTHWLTFIKEDEL